MTSKEYLSIYYGNIEDAWSSSDSSEDTPIQKISLLDDETAQKNKEYKDKFGIEPPQEHHSW